MVGLPQRLVRCCSMRPTPARCCPADIVVPLSSTLDEFKVPSIPLPAGCVRSASVLNIRSVDRIGNGIWIDAYTM